MNDPRAAVEEWVIGLSDTEFRQLAAYLGAAGHDGQHPWVPRPEQTWREHGVTDPFLWFFRAGRGTGKTRAAAEWVREEIEAHGPIRVALVGPTFADGRDTMVEGDAGILRVLPERLMPLGRDRHWNRSIGELKLSDGSFLKIHSSENPGRLRGPSWNRAWCDEPAEWKDAGLGMQGDTTYFNLLAGLRLPGSKIAVTGTPKPLALIRQLAERCETESNWVETRGRTVDNLPNLSAAFADEVVALYAGTRLGRQELEGEILEGLGDLFNTEWLSTLTSVPGGGRWRARCWDLAGSEESPENPDPDWTVGALLSLDPDTRNVTVEHISRFRSRQGTRDREIQAVAIRDREKYGPNVRVYIEQEPGSGGKAQVEQIARDLDGIAPVKAHRSQGTKYSRAAVVASAMEQGRVSIVVPQAGEWDLQAFLSELTEFREDEKHPHDDIIDALSLFWQVMPSRVQDFGASPVSVGKVSNRRW